MGGPSSTVERRIAEIAGRSHGVVTRSELLVVGVTARQIDRRLTKGTLIKVHRGVYRVGHAAPSTHALYLAAVRACGAGAVLTGRSAAWLWEIIQGRAPVPEVTTRNQRRVHGIKCRRSRSLTCQDSTLRLGIPVTTLPRTLIDLAPSLPAPALCP